MNATFASGGAGVPRALFAARNPPRPLPRRPAAWRPSPHRAGVGLGQNLPGVRLSFTKCRSFSGLAATSFESKSAVCSIFARAKRGRVVQSEYEKSNRRHDRPTDPARPPKFKELKFSQTRQKASFKIDHAEFSGASFIF